MTTTHAEPLEAVRRPILGWSFVDGWTVARRDVRKIFRVPEQLFFSIVQPIIFVLMFAFVFGGAIPIPGGGSYREYLMAGIFAQTVAFNAAGTTVGLADDMQKGIIDRFRSLPMSASAVVAGRTTADVVRGAITLAVLVPTGLAVGWRINDGIAKALFALVLLLVFGYAMSWIGAWVGLHMPSTEVANTAGLIWLFPLTFLSNAFVPTQGMPAVIQTIAIWNPLSAVTASARELFGNPNPFVGDALPQQYPVAATLIWTVVLLAIFVPLARGRYRKTIGG